MKHSIFVMPIPCGILLLVVFAMYTQAKLDDMTTDAASCVANGTSSDCEAHTSVMLQVARASKNAKAGVESEEAADDVALEKEIEEALAVEVGEVNASVDDAQPDVDVPGYNYVGRGQCHPMFRRGWRGRQKAKTPEGCAFFCNTDPVGCTHFSFRANKVCFWYNGCQSTGLLGPHGPFHTWEKKPTPAPSPGTVVSPDWTQQEMLVAIEKFIMSVGLIDFIRDEWYKQYECYGEHPNSTATDFKYIPCSYLCTEPRSETGCGTSQVPLPGAQTYWYYATRGLEVQGDLAMMIRFGFHSCLKNKDGSGGCNGLLSLDRAFALLQPWGKARPELPWGRPMDPSGHNANLGLLGDMLEKIYSDPKWPMWSRPLPRSFKEQGKSRADLWALIATFCVHRNMMVANAACDRGASIYSEAMMPSGFPCKMTPARSLKFYSGRVDGTDAPTLWRCDESCAGPDWGNTCMSNREACGGCADCPRFESYDGTMLYRPRAYENTKEEDAPKAWWNGPRLTEFFNRSFGFNKRETIAIMGGHGTGQFHLPVDGGFRYMWTHKQESQLNNFYYRIIATLPGRHYESGLLSGIGLRHPVAVGTVQNQLARTGMQLAPQRFQVGGGPFLWFHQYERCPTCQDGVNVDKHRDLWMKNGFNYGDRCCELCAKATSAEKLNVSEWKYRLEGLTAEEEEYFHTWKCIRNLSVHETSLSVDNGLAKKFEVDEASGFPQGCLSWETCPRNDDVAEESTGMTMADIVDEYANDQDKWATDFIVTWEKMLTNGVPDGTLKEALDFTGVECKRGIKTKWEAQTEYGEGAERKIGLLWKCTKST